MNILISGYGKMGREIEAQALKRGHRIVDKIDKSGEWSRLSSLSPQPDVVIDFSQPEVVVDILKRCFDAGIPVVTGTTGWYERKEEVAGICNKKNGTLFYAPNFSIGVNVFFRVNRLLARLMAGLEGYSVLIDETHHIQKLDAPSGTAIKIAEEIMDENPQFKKWMNEISADPSVLSIVSKRVGEVTGTHSVVYESDADAITLKHQARNRSGFALGALLAAGFVLGKQGVFTMDDLLDNL